MIEDRMVVVSQEAWALFSDVTYKNENYWYGEAERPLKLSMYVPKHRKNHGKMPLLVWLCGGAFQVVDRNVWMPQMLVYAKHGYIVASVEYRTVEDVPFPASLVDVKAAIRYLKAHADHYCIDKTRVFVMGESAGGALACQVGIMSGIPEYDIGDFLNESSEVNGVIDFYGPAENENYEEQIMGDPMMYAAFVQRIGGLPEKRQDVLKASSAINYINPNTPPFLIVHGTEDEKVDIAQSERLYNRLVENGIPCDFIRVIGAKHGTDEFYQKEIENIVLAFLDKYSHK